MERRSLFDQMSLNCLYYLDNCFPESSISIDFQAGEEALSHEIMLWEKKNAPYKLPSDLCNFFSVFNGVNVIWSIDVAAEKPSISVGELRINKVEDIKEISMDHIINISSLNILGGGFSVFSLDKYCLVGEIVLLYRHGNSSDNTSSFSNFDSIQDAIEGFIPRQLYNSSSTGLYNAPEVWLIDQSSRLHYISSSFTHYFRVMIAHLGIIGWQLAFTPEGLPMQTQQWMGMFCKERLIVDRYCHEKLN